MLRIRPLLSGRLPRLVPLVLFFILFDAILVSKTLPGSDLAPLWTAGHLARADPAKVYDFALITRLQVPLVGDIGPRPFVYPPTALIALVPLSLLPFYLALACVSLGGWLALSRVSVGSHEPILLMISPPVVLAAIGGQPTLAVAALIAAGLTRLDSDEIGAGILLGCAAMLKPTLLIMAPLGLAGGRHWRALAIAAGTSVALLDVSILLFGAGSWPAWLAATGRFQRLFDGAAPLYRNGITPHALALQAGVEADWLPLLIAPLVAIATLVIFVRTTDWRARLIAIIGGSLLVSPYAMNYEVAALAPAMFALRRETLTDVAVAAVWAAALFFNASLLGLLLGCGWVLAKILPRRPHASAVILA